MYTTADFLSGLDYANVSFFCTRTCGFGSTVLKRMFLSLSHLDHLDRCESDARSAGKTGTDIPNPMSSEQVQRAPGQHVDSQVS